MFDKISTFFSRAKEGKKGFPAIAQSCKENFIEVFKQLTPHERVLVFGIIIAAFAFIPLVSGYVTFFMIAMEPNSSYTIVDAMSQTPLRYTMIGWTLGIAGTITLITLVILIMIMFVIVRSPELSPIAEVDENGIAYSKNGTYGTAHWLSKKEAEQVYDIGNIKEATGYILGQFERKGDGTKGCISLPTSSSGNQNYLVIGSPGKGKTFSFGFNAVLQAMVRNESIIIVDPKGELCEKLFTVCEAHGYNTKLYNLVDPTHSNAWNFANEVFDPNTGNLDLSRLQSFVSIIMTNTIEGEKEDSFWGSGEKNLFTAATGYLAWKHEITYAENLRRASEDWENISLVRMSKEDRERTFQIIQDERSSIRDIEIALSTIMRASNLVSEDMIRDYLKEIRNDSDPITIDRIFAMFVKNDLNALMDMFDQANMPMSHPAAITWSIFKHSDKKIQPNFVQGLTQRLMLFANTDLNSMSAHDDINFRELGERKTAIFCVISASDSSRKLLSSLFFSFLFKDVAEAADELGPENRIPVNVICDEFANIGRIPDFDRFISTVRSRKIYISIIIQSIAQLATVYDEHLQETIIECCDTLVFLGCNGPETAQFISELSGVASIIVSNIRDNKTVSGMRGMTQGYATSEGAGKRYLINPDEAKALDPEEVLIYHAGLNLLRAYRCGYINHPYFKELANSQKRIATFPTVTELYGQYSNTFEDVSIQNLSEQKVRNEIAAKLQMAGISPQKPTVEAPKKTFIPPKPVSFMSKETMHKDESSAPAVKCPTQPSTNSAAQSLKKTDMAKKEKPKSFVPRNPADIYAEVFNPPRTQRKGKKSKTVQNISQHKPLQ